MSKIIIPENKILLLDIESSNLAANFGFPLCVGYMWLNDKKAQAPSLIEYPGSNNTDDSKLMQHMYDVMVEADQWVTWYGKKFDIPFLQSRMLKHGIGVLPPTPHVDGWEIARNKLKLNSNRLKSVENFLELEEKFGIAKTELKPEMWIRAMAGDHKAMKYIQEHAIQDVLVLKEAYLLLAPLTVRLPRVAEYGRCAFCGGSLRDRGGIARTGKRAGVRLQCRECGKWETKPLDNHK